MFWLWGKFLTPFFDGYASPVNGQASVACLMGISVGPSPLLRYLSPPLLRAALGDPVLDTFKVHSGTTFTKVF